MDIFSSVKDIMIKKVLTVTPDAPLIEAINYLLEKDISGLPVLDKDRRVVGIITEYDIATKGSLADLATYVRLIQEYRAHNKQGQEEKSIFESIKRISATAVRTVMNSDPLVLKQDASVNEAVQTFIEHHRVNPIPIVDDGGRLVGILSRHDLIKLFYTSRYG